MESNNNELTPTLELEYFAKWLAKKHIQNAVIYIRNYDISLAYQFNEKGDYKSEIYTQYQNEKLKEEQNEIQNQE